MAQSPRLQVVDITKSYPGVVANDKVNLTVNPGEIHALLGENGAGKSTLVKYIYGVHEADEGRLVWEGKELQISNPSHARKLGIGMVFQHFSLFDAMTVEQNIALGIDRKQAGGDLPNRIRDVSAHHGLFLDPSRYVHTLSVGERQRIEVVRCLLQNPQLLIMDEPTSVLTPQEVENLFKTLRLLSSAGVSILYISHKLQEIKALCHAATIMRRGKVVARCKPEEQTTESMAEMMMGQNVSSPVRSSAQTKSRVSLDIVDLNVSSTHQQGTDLKNINLQVLSGEIMSVAGIAGNGQREFLEVLSGEVLVDDPSMIRFGDIGVGRMGPMDRRKIGAAFVPEERLGHGAVPDMSLWENVLLSAGPQIKLVKNGFIRLRAAQKFTEEIVGKFRVVTQGVRRAANSLSGGNLQKFIIGREIIQNPRLIVAVQPTWGVDAGAAVSIRQALIDLAGTGAAVLIVSQDLEELFEISDRICVISNGCLSAPRPTASVTVQEIGLLMGEAGLGGKVAIPV